MREPELAEAWLYDGLDRRDARLVITGGTSRLRERSYLGTTELLSRELDSDSTGAGEPTEKMVKSYDYDSQGMRIGQQLEPKGEGAGQPTYSTYDHDGAGSVIGLEDDEGTFDDPDSPGEDSDNRYDFDPYGSLQDPEPGNSVSDVEAELPTAAASNPFRYEGFYYDSGINSYDMQAREYRPEVGRFLSQDRFEAAGADLALQSDPLTQNRYAFAGGNPVSNIEWDGHRPVANAQNGPVNSDGRSVGNGNGGNPEGSSAPPEQTEPLPSSTPSSESSPDTSPSGGTPQPAEPKFSPGFGAGPPIPQNAAARKLVKSVFDLQGAQAQYQQKVENLNRIEAEEYAYIEDHKGAGAGELFDAFFGIHNALDVATLIPVTKLGRAGKVGKLFKGADDFADIKRAASAIYAPAKAKAASAVSGARGKLGTAYQKVARRSGDQRYYHYTDERGRVGIQRSETIKPSNGRVYVSPTRYGSGQQAQRELGLAREPSGFFEVPGNRLPGLQGPGPVKPTTTQPGGGVECFVTCSVDARGLDYTPLGR